MSVVKTLLGAVAATAIMASGAHATTIAFENFESYSPTVHGDGVYDLNFNSFTHGFHPTDGTVDLIGTPNPFNLSGSSNYIDLDGSTNDGAIFRSNAFNFVTGDKITLSFDLAGNKRGGTDQWDFGFQTEAGNIAFNSIIRTGPLDLGPGGSAFGPAIGAGDNALASNSGWTHYSLSFIAGNSGSATAYVATTSADNIGPLVDNIRLSSGAVPEPSTWALMIGGFGLAGAALRRRRAVTA